MEEPSGLPADAGRGRASEVLSSRTKLGQDPCQRLTRNS